MNIDLLAKMICELILEKDEVSLPGLGTFVAEEVEAGFSDKGFTINPPYRRLSFRQKASRDNSLAMLYARDNSVSEKEAEDIVNGFLRQLGIVLKEKKNIILPGLGRLRATKQNNFFFVQDQETNIYPEGFGLESLSLKSLAGTKAVEIPEPAPDNSESVPLPPVKEETPVMVSRRRNRTWMSVMIAFAALVLLFFLAVAIIGRVAPEFIDPYLYSPEELEILKDLTNYA